MSGEYFKEFSMKSNVFKFCPPFSEKQTHFNKSDFLSTYVESILQLINFHSLPAVIDRDNNFMMIKIYKNIIIIAKVISALYIFIVNIFTT